MANAASDINFHTDYEGHGLGATLHNELVFRSRYDDDFTLERLNVLVASGTITRF